MKNVRVVAGALIKDHKVLATQRGYGDFKGGWEFPGGKIEDGETPEAALQRELREELAIEVQVGKTLGCVEYDYPTFHLSMQVFVCTLVSDHVTLLEHEAAKWVSCDEVDEVAWLPADFALLAPLKECLKEDEREGT